MALPWLARHDGVRRQTVPSATSHRKRATSERLQNEVTSAESGLAAGLLSQRT